MLISYKNDPILKKRFVAEIEKHRKADAIMQGTYGKENGKWKGCAVSCSLRSLDILEGKELKTVYDSHRDYESKLGIPEWLARLEDTIFEGLPEEDAMKWPTQFAKAVPVGVNLEPVRWKFCAYLMKENINRVLGLKNLNDELKKQVVDAIRGVLNVHEEAIRTGEWDELAADSAWSSAWLARSAADSAAWSAVWPKKWVARSAADSAWSSAWSSAWLAMSAAESVWLARSRKESYIKYSKKLIKLLKEAGDDQTK
jgi:hypothetical protein